MTSGTWEAVDQYVEGLFAPADPALEAALRASAEAGLPNISVSPAQGRLLQILARAVSARRILEIGTLGGYSTIWLARALPPDGRVVTLEAVDRHAEVARGNLERAGVWNLVEIRRGRAQETLPRLVEEAAGPFDFVFIDADKPGYVDYLDWSLKLTRPGSVIVADNVVRGGTVTGGGGRDENVEGVRRFNQRLAEAPGVWATVVQTVGVKGYDGFAVAVVAG